MADATPFQAGVFAAEVVDQVFRPQVIDGEEILIFSLGVTIEGRENAAGQVVPDPKVTRGTVDLFFTADQLGPPPPLEPGKSAKTRTIDVLKFMGCAGLKFSQLDPTVPGYKDLKGTKLRVYGSPQKRKPQYARYSVLLDSKRGPRVSAAGAGATLDNLFPGALGKKPVNVDPAPPANVEGQAAGNTEPPNDDIPFG